MDIYTIGHSNYSIERLIEMLKYFEISCVVDIRGTPYCYTSHYFHRNYQRKSKLKYLIKSMRYLNLLFY